MGLVVIHVHARSRTTETATVALPGSGHIVRKRWAWPRHGDRLKGALRTTWAARSPARREFEALSRLHVLACGRFAPDPLAYAEHRSGGVLRACILAVTEVPNSLDLARWLGGTAPSALRQSVLRRLAERTRSMHDAGLADFEMHPRNVLVVPATGEVLKVDCAKQRVRRGAASRRDRVRDLAALDVGLVRLVDPSERDYFLRAYLGADETRAAAQALGAEIETARARIDDRESRRLPGVE